MKLSNDLNTRLNEAKTNEDVAKILNDSIKKAAEAGIILEDDDLVDIAGGVDGQIGDTKKYFNLRLVTEGSGDQIRKVYVGDRDIST